MESHNQQDNLLGQSDSFLEVLEHVSQVAQLNKPVLIIGERDRQRLLRRLHYLSSRWDQKWLNLIVQT